jgi:demethylmenaquinone methyltransferase/2-methoxy-6-polyprenyl-1,4-benzoquinol methylase
VTDLDRQLLDEQVAYYRARAGEYDDTSMPDGDPYAAHAAVIREAVRALELRGRVLELAAGTGQWSGLLAERADDLLVTDASPEMLAIHRAKVGRLPNVRREVADAFTERGERFDAVFFGFFLSHVPPPHFERFWAVLAGMLAPGGRIGFVDEGRHFSWREQWVDRAAGIVTRHVSDGSTHRAVKVLWDPAELAYRLRALGWDALVQAEGPFYWGSAERR